VNLAGRERDQRSITEQSIPDARARQALSRTPAAARRFFSCGKSGDVENRVIATVTAFFDTPQGVMEKPIGQSFALRTASWLK